MVFCKGGLVSEGILILYSKQNVCNPVKISFSDNATKIWKNNYREVPRWETSMEQEFRFGLELGQLA